MPTAYSAIRAGCVFTILIAALAIPPPAASRPVAPMAHSAATPAAICSNSTITLYDGKLGGTPNTQGMNYLTNPLTVSATQVFSDGVTILDTTPQPGESAGYFGKPALVPALDRTSGYTLTFGVQVLSEDHNNENRAGLSVIALSSDTRGIELGFWENEVWAQEGGTTELFTHAEGTPFTTTTGLISYTLTIRGDTYDLLADGTSILTGTLRDYSAFVGPINPYNTPNFIFLGDDTSSARAKIRLAALAVTVPQCTEQYTHYLPLVNFAE